MIEPSNVERAEWTDTTREYVEELEQTINTAADILRKAATTWATHPSGMVSVKRLLDEADKLEGK